MEEKNKTMEVKVDPMNLLFARAMEIFTYIGLFVMIIPGVLYLFMGNGYVSTANVVQHWSKPASEFWKIVKDIHISGYSWFLTHLHKFDCLSYLGIMLLALAPAAAIVAAMTKAEKKYKIILFIAVLESIFSIVRPLLMTVKGH